MYATQKRELLKVELTLQNRAIYLLRTQNLLNFSVQKPLLTEPVHKSLWPVVLVSVLVHGLLGLLLYSAYKPSQIIPSQPVETITARLVFTQPQVVKNAELDLLDEPIESPTQPIAEVPSQIVQSEQPTPSVQPQTKHSAQREDLPPIIPNSSSSINNEPLKIDPKKMVSAHISTLNQQAHEQMIESATSEYQEQKNRLDLTVRAQNRFQTEDEKLQEQLTKNVDCSNTLSKSMVMLASFTGGVLRCTPNQPIGDFIQNRLNKGVDPKEANK